MQHKYCIPFLLYSNVDTVLQMQRQQHYCLSSSYQLVTQEVPADMTDLFIPDELICTCKSVLYEYSEFRLIGIGFCCKKNPTKRKSILSEIIYLLLSSKWFSYFNPQ